MSNVIIDNRLSRGSLNKTLLYCIKLREMDEESLCNGNKTENEESFAPPEKRSRISNDDVFLAPLESISSNDSKEDKEHPVIKQSNYDSDSMHMLLPKVPCLTPASIATNTPSTSSLTAHLSRPPLNIPSLSFDPYQQKMELPNQTTISVSMPDISTLINGHVGIHP